jgi:hypothetical protein
MFNRRELEKAIERRNTNPSYKNMPKWSLDDLVRRKAQDKRFFLEHTVVAGCRISR